MPGREDHSISSGPQWVGRVVSHVLVVQQEGEWSQRHRRTRMSGVCLLHRIHRKRANRINGELLQVGAWGLGQVLRPRQVWHSTEESRVNAAKSVDEN